MKSTIEDYHCYEGGGVIEMEKEYVCFWSYLAHKLQNGLRFINKFVLSSISAVLCVQGICEEMAFAPEQKMKG